MATDPDCVVQVGIHPGPFYVRPSDGARFCDRHRRQMIQAGHNGPADFERTEEPGRG